MLFLSLHLCSSFSDMTLFFLCRAACPGEVTMTEVTQRSDGGHPGEVRGHTGKTKTGEGRRASIPPDGPAAYLHTWKWARLLP